MFFTETGYAILANQLDFWRQKFGQGTLCAEVEKRVVELPVNDNVSTRDSINDASSSPNP